MSDINKITGQQWKALSDEERIEYKGKGQSDFQRKAEKWSAAQGLAQFHHTGLSEISFVEESQDFESSDMHVPELGDLIDKVQIE